MDKLYKKDVFLVLLHGHPYIDVASHSHFSTIPRLQDKSQLLHKYSVVNRTSSNKVSDSHGLFTERTSGHIEPSPAIIDASAGKSVFNTLHLTFSQKHGHYQIRTEKHFQSLIEKITLNLGMVSVEKVFFKKSWIMMLQAEANLSCWLQISLYTKVYGKTEFYQLFDIIQPDLTITDNL